MMSRLHSGELVLNVGETVGSKRRPQTPSTDCSTCPLQHLRLSLIRFCWSYTAWQFAQSSCWARPVSTESENQPVCLLLAFRWQCGGLSYAETPVRWGGKWNYCFKPNFLTNITAKSYYKRTMFGQAIYAWWQTEVFIFESECQIIHQFSYREPKH